LHPGEQGQHKGHQAHEEAWAVSESTVLVVEDDPVVRAVLDTALRDEGYRVVSAVDGGALAAACRHRPAVVLLDLTMPRMDGAEVSRRLRADPATAGIPIILMSADPDLRARSAHLPVNERLAKPFDLDRLYALIAKWETISAGERLYWRVSDARSYAFDRQTRRVVAWCISDRTNHWWALIRRPPGRYGPFETALHARQEAAQHLVR
jgi:CheY-like chemotaxis protein